MSCCHRQPTAAPTAYCSTTANSTANGIRSQPQSCWQRWKKTNEGTRLWLLPHNYFKLLKAAT